MWPENERWLQAFDHLVDSRNASFTCGRILYGEILAYAQLMGISNTQTLVRRIRACDSAWLDFRKTST